MKVLCRLCVKYGANTEAGHPLAIFLTGLSSNPVTELCQRVDRTSGLSYPQCIQFLTALFNNPTNAPMSVKATPPTENQPQPSTMGCPCSSTSIVVGLDHSRLSILAATYSVNPFSCYTIQHSIAQPPFMLSIFVHSPQSSVVNLPFYHRLQPHQTAQTLLLFHHISTSINH